MKGRGRINPVTLATDEIAATYVLSALAGQRHSYRNASAGLARATRNA
jgi:hypothetical protein